MTFLAEGVALLRSPRPCRMLPGGKWQDTAMHCPKRSFVMAGGLELWRTFLCVSRISVRAASDHKAVDWASRHRPGDRAETCNGGMRRLIRIVICAQMDAQDMLHTDGHLWKNRALVVSTPSRRYCFTHAGHLENFWDRYVCCLCQFAGPMARRSLNWKPIQNMLGVTGHVAGSPST
jgi:hypothetical protein